MPEGRVVPHVGFAPGYRGEGIRSQRTLSAVGIGFFQYRTASAEVNLRKKSPQGKKLKPTGCRDPMPRRVFVVWRAYPTSSFLPSCSSPDVLTKVSSLPRKGLQVPFNVCIILTNEH